MNVTIWRADSPLARCNDCGSQKQFHGQPRHSCEAFVPETIADYEPADLSPAQLVSEIHRLSYPSDMRLTGWTATDADITRSKDCRSELRTQIGQILEVDFEDLQEALR